MYYATIDLEADPTVGKCKVLQAYFVLLRSVATCSNCTLSYRQKMHNLESKGRVCKIVSHQRPQSLQQPTDLILIERYILQGYLSFTVTSIW